MENPQNAGHYRKHNLSNSNSLENGKKSAPSTPSKAVNFNENSENEKHREKYLTAKYGAHQMALIRKRLKVEMWMYDHLQKLFSSEEESKSNYVELDLDEVLDIEEDTQRRRFILNVLIRSKASREDKNKFIDDLLEKAKTL